MRQKIKLGRPDTRFISPGGNLSCLGRFEATTSYKERQYTFPIYVIQGSCNSLLGRSEAVRMGLVRRVEEISSPFGLSGLLKTEPVKIALHEDAIRSTYSQANTTATCSASKARTAAHGR